MMLKKLFLSLMVASCALLVASAEEIVLKEGPGYGSWGPKQMKFEKSAKNGVYMVKVVDNSCAKPGEYNLQLFSGYDKGLKSGVKYQVSFTIKASADLKVASAISLNVAPWSGFAWKTINLKAGEAQDVTLTYTPKENIEKSVRVPMLACGFAKSGTEIEVSNTRFVEVK